MKTLTTSAAVETCVASDMSYLSEPTDLMTLLILTTTDAAPMADVSCVEWPINRHGMKVAYEWRERAMWPVWQSC